MVWHIHYCGHIHIMLLLRAFSDYTLTHYDRQVRQEVAHRASRITKMKNFMRFHLAILIAGKFFVESLVGHFDIRISLTFPYAFYSVKP